MTGLPSRLRPTGRSAPRLRAVETPVEVPRDDAVAETGLRWARHYRDRLRSTDATIVAIVTLASVAVRLVVVGAPVANEGAIERIGVPVAIAAAWLLALSAFRTRDPHILGVGAVEYRRIINATATAFGLIAILFLIIQTSGARWYLVAAPIGGAALLLTRWLWRRWLFLQRNNGRYLSRAIIVGTRHDVEYVAHQIADDAGAGFVVVGAVLDDDDRADLVVGGRRIHVLGGVDGTAEVAAAQHADSVIVTGRLGDDGHDDDGEQIRRLSWALEGTATELVLSSRLTDVAGPRIHFRPVEGLPLLHVEIPTFDGWRHTVKRSFDIVFAFTALFLVAPFLLVIAVLIKLDSPGPVFFRQTRCGRDGRTFEMLKFRSMVATAEEDLAGLLDRNEGAGVLFKIRNDPRVTRIGRVLRSHSLDELPQFWNILVGDMSVVGPRPPLVSEAECYEAAAKRRLMIKPGLTGLWQISGRSDLTWEESVRLDLYYVENWSLTGDVMIVWRTIKTVLHPAGAY
ncbi:sugar transferase [Agromyces sp. Marseille-Q5079]|uniref:sugar transferase n=1 Tax=Agromyces sp. Marseille-Q5079 TaxID=3439059 RepID=UPI003D9CBC92